MTWVDSHCHLPADPGAAGLILDRARAAGVAWVVCVGTDLATSRAAVALAESHPDVYATVGLHPHDASSLGDEWPGLVDLAAHPRVVAIGEAGFDLHYEHSPRAAQATAFAAQVRLALELNTSLVIHSRLAWDATFGVLESEGVPEHTVFHCFSGGPVEAERAIALGCFLSFSGIVTFKNADDVRGAAAIAPADRVLVETDAPFLAPVPHRGRENESAFVVDVGAGLARARSESAADVARTTAAAASVVFRV